MFKGLFHLSGQDLVILEFIAEKFGLGMLVKGIGGMAIGKYLAPIIVLMFIYHAIPSSKTKKN